MNLNIRTRVLAMVTPHRVLVAVVLTAGFLGSGCSQLPKDAYLKDVDIGATPWTPTMKIGVAATGSAARNLTAEERREMLTPSKKP